MWIYEPLTLNVES